MKRRLISDSDLSRINIPELIADIDDLLTVVQKPEQQGKKYFFQTDPTDGQVYIYENNWSDKLGECLVTITKPEAELSLEEQELLKDRR